jgi:hypothetical protein
MTRPFYGFPGTVARCFGRPGLFLGEALYETGQPLRERATLRRILPPEAEVGVGVDRARDDRVVGEEPDLGTGVLASYVREIPHGLYASFPNEYCTIPQRR